MIIRQLCEYKNVEIVEAHAMKDHIHMMVRIPPKISVSGFMGYLKENINKKNIDELLPWSKKLPKELKLNLK